MLMIVNVLMIYFFFFIILTKYQDFFLKKMKGLYYYSLWFMIFTLTVCLQEALKIPTTFKGYKAIQPSQKPEQAKEAAKQPSRDEVIETGNLGSQRKRKKQASQPIDLTRGVKQREFEGGINGLFDLVYTSSRAKDRPKECKQLIGGTPVYVCTNTTTTTHALKISSFEIVPLPLMKGYASFKLVAKLTKDITIGSKLYLDAFSGKTRIYSGQLELCDHITFANFKCPVRAKEGFIEHEQALYVPEEVPSELYSFVARAVTAKGEELTTVVASIDVRSDLESTIDLKQPEDGGKNYKQEL